MRIGILGTGTLATALGELWRRAGHDVVLGGRSQAAVPLREAAQDRDAVLVAVPWTALREVLTAAAIPPGTPLIDPTNAWRTGSANCWSRTAGRSRNTSPSGRRAHMW